MLMIFHIWLYLLNKLIYIFILEKKVPEGVTMYGSSGTSAQEQAAHHQLQQYESAVVNTNQMQHQSLLEQSVLLGAKFASPIHQQQHLNNINAKCAEDNQHAVSTTTNSCGENSHSLQIDTNNNVSAN